MNQNQPIQNTLVMNNYFGMTDPNHLRGHSQGNFNHQRGSIEQIMSYFNTRYKNILPNRLPMNYDFKSMLFPFEKHQIVELIQQMEILVQLVFQNFLFCSKEETKFKSYELLMKIYNQKLFVTSYLNYMPIYQIPLSTFNTDFQHSHNASHNLPSQNLTLSTKPQMSVLQTPLLEFTEFIISIKGKSPSKEKTNEMLLHLTPLIQKDWLPIFSDINLMNQGSARTKFNHIDDNLLLIGLTKYGGKNLELIQVNILPDKRVSEIKNRYKNLICGRATDNRIKRWKILQFAPLKENEKYQLQKAIEWFGSYDRYHLITRYFLTDRSPEFLKAELNQSETLVKKRSKYENLMLSPESPLEVTTFLNQDQQQERSYRSTFDILNSMSKSFEPIQGSMELEEGGGGEPAIDRLSEQFEPVTIDFSSNSKVIEEEDKGANSGFPFLNRHENFEMEELGIPQFLNGSSEEFMFGCSFMESSDGKKFKKIDSMIFEYEEI